METSEKEDIYHLPGGAGDFCFPRHGNANSLVDLCAAPRGLRQRRNGSWKAHIWHPVSRQRLKLGTFSTAEEVRRCEDEHHPLYKPSISRRTLFERSPTTCRQRKRTKPP